MHVSTTHVLRKFAQKMAAQNTQANPLAGIGDALKDPRVLGSLGGAAVGGLGGLGLARLTQSEEDKEKGNTPWLAPLLGALAGGAGGYYGGPHLAGLFGKKPEVTHAGTTFNHELSKLKAKPAITMPKNPNRSLLSSGPRKNFSLPQAELAKSPDGNVDVSTAESFMNGATGPDLAAMQAAGEEPMMTLTGHGGQVGNESMRNARR